VFKHRSTRRSNKGSQAPPDLNIAIVIAAVAAAAATIAAVAASLLAEAFSLALLSLA
jgi:hypothetical protein